MKKTSVRALIVVLITLAVWIAFRMLTPESPLGVGETVLVLLLVSVLILSAEWLLRRIQGGNGAQQARKDGS
jgi:hypothetical protein